jgi:nicotinamide riboside transporter PnuC
MFGTWNVNGKMPESLDGWLRTDQPPPDLYAIGYTLALVALTKACGCDSHHNFLTDCGKRRFQELDLSAQALVLGDTTRSHPWVEAIMLSLSKVADYHMVRTTSRNYLRH